MNVDEEQANELDRNQALIIPVSVLALFKELWEHRRLLAACFVLGGVLCACVALLLPPSFTATAQLMPPDSSTLANPSVLGTLSGAGAALPGLGSSLLNARSPGGTVIGIFGSRTVQDSVITRFHLLDRYHCKYLVDARRILVKHTTIEEDKKSGLLIISVTDREGKFARDMVNEYIEALNSQLSLVSTSSARSERIFLEDRLKDARASLESAESEFSAFSSKNAMLDIQGQGLSVLNNVGRIQGELMATQSELALLRTQATDENPQVKGLRARMAELQSQLRLLGGVGESVNTADLSAEQIYPSLRKLPLLGATYYKLFHRVAEQASVYEVLTKQYEIARIQEAKEIPRTRVLDPPEIPEKRTWPPRAEMTIIGAIGFMLAAALWILLCGTWKLLDDAMPVKILFRGIAAIISG